MFADMIRNSNGKPFRCLFYKKDGSKRELYGCLRPKKNGKGLRYNPNNHGLIPVFDLDKNDYRMINIDGIEFVEILDEK
ncbi:MAG TPA: SH3 beta-barrel fold-containing protein [Methanofastidiosum sp.]|nr:SH3 beta-barrel fold-containing protein [Methanofastidiosum sp.]